MSQRDDAEATAAAVHRAMSLFVRRARESKTSEVSLPERTVLSRLDRHGPDTIAVLARWEEITPQAMGATVAALEARGLVTKSPDPSDGRRSILTVTDQGVAVVQAGRGQLTDRLAATLEGEFTADELDQIRTAAPLIERLGSLL
jgi:DNA-binding MarR family transcriptional regulator